MMASAKTIQESIGAFSLIETHKRQTQTQVLPVNSTNDTSFGLISETALLLVETDHLEPGPWLTTSTETNQMGCIE